MKKILFSLAVLATSIVSSQVLIDDTNTVDTPTAGAVLDLNSQDKGLLMPRLSNQDVSALEVEGMVYYDVELKCFRGWNGDAWVALGGVCLESGEPSIPDVYISSNVLSFNEEEEYGTFDIVYSGADEEFLVEISASASPLNLFFDNLQVIPAGAGTHSVEFLWDNNTTDDGDVSFDFDIVISTSGDYNIVGNSSVNITIEEDDAAAGETYTETFENIPPNNSSYSTRTWTGDQGLTWTATNARTDETIDGRAITIQGTGRLTTTIPNGISELTLTTQRKYGGGSGDLTVYINEVSVDVIPFGESVQTTTISNINASGDVELEIYVPNDRIAMDNLTWTTNP